MAAVQQVCLYVHSLERPRPPSPAASSPLLIPILRSTQNVQVSVVSGELTRGWYSCEYEENFLPYLLATLSRHQSLPVLGVVASY